MTSLVKYLDFRVVNHEDERSGRMLDMVDGFYEPPGPHTILFH